MSANETTGAPFHLEKNTPGVGMSSMGTWNQNLEKLNKDALHKSLYDPQNVGADIFRAGNHRMTGYVKSVEYSPISASDNVLAAVAKLEAAASNSGDMRKATYDTNDDGKVDHAEVADKANSVDWNSVNNRPNSMPNPNALIIQTDGQTRATYTGSSAATVNITANNIGAASLVGGKVPVAQIPDEIATSAELAVVAASVNTAKGEAITEAVKQATAYANPALPDIDTVGGALDHIVEHGSSGGDTDMTIIELLHNRIYPGVDLQEKFQSEIFNGYSTPWDWIADRIYGVLGKPYYKGILVNDFIPLVFDTTHAKMEVAGINTYHRYGDTEVPPHIDFISGDCLPDPYVYNRVNYNNGTTVSPSPWLASDLHARLNSLQKNVPNSAAANPAMVSVDYRTTGIFNRLPAALQAVIVEKRLLLPSRYTAGSLLIDDNSWAWQNAGKLWIPAEMEVYGTKMWGSTVSPNHGFPDGGFVQYPIFAQNMKRVKGAGNGGVRSNWWLLSAYGGNSTNCALVLSNGTAYHTTASNTSIRVPLCFRVA